MDPYRMIAASLDDDVETNLRMGKTLGRFKAFSPLAAESLQNDDFARSAGLLRRDGSVANRHGAFSPPDAALIPDEAPPEGESIIVETPQALHILRFVSGGGIFRELGLTTATDDTEGFLDVVVDKTLYAPILREIFHRFLVMLALGTVCVAALVILLFHVVPLHGKRAPAPTEDGAPPVSRKRVLCMTLLPLLIGQIALSAIFFDINYRASEANMRESARSQLRILTTKIQHVLDLGIELEEIRDLGPYLERVAKKSTVVSALHVLDASGKALYGSGAFDADNPGNFVESLRDAQGSLCGTARSEVNIELLRDHVRTLLLDVGTSFVISVLLIVECMMLVLCLYAPRARRKGDKTRDRMRGLAFFYYFAIDLSISFVPLHMKQLLQGSGGAPSTVLLGLPVSAEMAAAGVSVLLTGLLSFRIRPIMLLVFGIALTALGNLSAFLVSTPGGYVAARALVGFGYGFCLMSMQNMVVADSRENARGANIAIMFIGLFAGSVCGSSLGGMLAERFGFASVFALSAGMTFLLLPLIFWTRGRRLSASLPAVAEKARFSLRETAAFIGQREIAGLFLLMALPAAIVYVGLINFFIPVTLEEAGVGQSDIGRLFMVYSLIFIFFSRRIGSAVEAMPRQSTAVAWGGALGAASLFCLALPAGVFSPFWLAFGAVCFAGLASVVNTSAQIAYLLNRPAVARVGSEMALSLYTLSERVGQVGGPLLFGSAMLVLGGTTLMSIGGGVALGGAALFCLVAREKN
jgi:MFS family permease